MCTTDRAAVLKESEPDGGVTHDEQVALQAAVEDAQARLHRAMADLDKMRNRCARQVVEERTGVRGESAGHWLPVVDNLERALESAARVGEPAPIVDGVRAVRDHAVSLLASLGFARHDEVRVPFDPYLHEAVGVAYDAEAEPGTVVQVVRPGYGEGDRRLRPAGVVVAGPRG
jgi:molecular chaperone GrpE